MKTLSHTRSIRNTLMVVVAVSAMTIPLLASAKTKNIKIAFDPTELNNLQGQEQLYEELKIASRKLCNMPNFKVIGPLSIPTGHVECYQGTLTAAVERLDIDAITALHNN